MSTWKSAELTRRTPYWKKSHTGTTLVNNNQGPSNQILLVLTERRHNDVEQMRWQNVSGANLQHAWSSRTRISEHGAEVQIVRKDDMVVLRGPRHDGLVDRSGVAYIGPVDGRPPVFAQGRRPRR